MVDHVWRIISYVWAGPWTLVGCMIGCLGIVTGGTLRIEGGSLEFAGGVIIPMLRSIPIQGGAVAITLGHVVLGITQSDLSRCRDHEQVHIRQYERWGPFFVPAYLLAGIAVWLRGKDPYRANPFEVEAFETTNHSPKRIFRA